MDLTVRDATPGDAPAIAELLAQLGYPTAAGAVDARLDRLSIVGDRVLVDDQRSDLRGGTVTLDSRRHLKMREADDTPVAVGHDDTIADDGQPLQPRFHGAPACGIAELRQQFRDDRRIAGNRVPDRQIHGTRL